MPGLKPSAEARIVNLRLIVPETGRQLTLNLQMIQLQLDDSNVFREKAPDIVRTNVQSSNSASLALRLDYHTYLPSTPDKASLGSRIKESRLPVLEIRSADS
jgi:hypothetical protein